MKLTNFRKSRWNRSLSLFLVASLCFLQMPVTFAQAMVPESADPTQIEPSEDLPEYVPGEFIVKLKEGHTLAELDGLRVENGILSAEPIFPKVASPEENLAELKQKRAGLDNPDHTSWFWWSNKESSEAKNYEARNAREKARLDAAIAAQTALVQKLVDRKKRAPEGSVVPSLEGIHLLKAASDADVSSLVAIFQSNPAVDYAQPNYKQKILQVPNDEFYSIQWGPQKIQADLAWDITTGSEDVIIAVIDTGVDYNHPDLAANIWSDPITGQHGYDFFNNDNDPMDDHGHGTHCSGIANAVTNNAIGVAGISWNSKIMALKFLSAAGSGDTVDGLRAIEWAVDHGADVLSNSWGGGPYEPPLQLAIDYADASGCVVVAAAGNSNTDRVFYPAAYNHVISVAATSRNDQRASFSNYGPSVDVAAPGVAILSTVPSSGAALRDPSGYRLLSGTSMACPHVAGLAGLLLAGRPGLSTQEVESVLKASSDDIYAQQIPDPLTGASVPLNPLYIGQGRINARKAVELIQGLPIGALVTQGLLTGPVIRGLAGGANFARYDLYHGKGINPARSEWVFIHGSTVPVLDDPATPAANNDGILYADFDPTTLEEGKNTLILVIQTLDGREIEYRTSVMAINFTALFPLNNDILRKGDSITVRGSILGSFLDYTVQYGEGKNPQVWKTEGISLLHPGAGRNVEGDLASWDTSVVPPTSLLFGNFYTLKISVTRESGVKDYFIYMVYLDDKLKQGWPQYIQKSSSGSADFADMKTADLDQDGIKEIITVRAGTEMVPITALFVYRLDGSLKWSKQLDGFGNGSIVPLIGDINRDGKNEIFVSVRDPASPSADKIYAFNGDGTNFGTGWPATIRLGLATLLMADLNQDGKNKIVARSHNSELIGGREKEFLFILNQAGVIEKEIEFPNQSRSFSRSPFQSVGNFDDDRELEIVLVSGTGLAGSSESAVFVFNPDGSLVSGWPARVDGVIQGSPAVGDVDGDGTDNVVVAANRGGVYVFEKNGSLMPGWPALRDESFQTQPALADFDRNGDLEVSIGVGRVVYLLDSFGRILPGWPQNMVLFENEVIAVVSTVIGDINGDGNADIITAAGGLRPLVVQSGASSFSGGVFAWNFDGTPIDLNPDSGFNRNLFTENVAIVPPVIDDLDGDGKVELVASSTDDKAWDILRDHKTKNRRSIYVWGLDAAYDVSKMPWPAFQHDNAHSGRVIVPRPLVPSAPANFSAEATSFSSIILRWTDTADTEQGFKVFRSLNGTDYTQIARLGRDVTSYLNRGLAPTTPYHYKITAYNTTGDSAPAGPMSITTPELPPAAPSALSAQAVSGTQINLNWTDQSSNETGFYLVRSESGAGGFSRIATLSANITSYVDISGLTPLTTYQYKVQAYHLGGSSEFSELASATTLEAPPRAPENLRARAVSPTQIDLTWRDKSDNETGFKVYQSVDETNFVEVANVDSSDVRAHSISGLNSNTRYFYKITAYNSMGESTLVGPVNAMTPNSPPAPPGSLHATLLVTPTSADRIQLTWVDQSNNEQGFRVFQSRDGGVSFNRIASPSANVTTYTTRALAVNATYHYQVIAYNNGGESEPSGLANETTRETPPEPPTSFRAQAVSPTQIDLAWRDPSDNEAGFKVYDGSLNLIAALGADVTSYSHLNLTPNTRYDYKVVAYNDLGESAVVGPVNATTFNTPPQAPTSLSATVLATGNEIRLTWTDQSNNEQNFKVFESVDGGEFTQIRSLGANVTTYTAGRLAINKTFSYKVQSYNNGGASEFAGPVSATTRDVPPAPPTSLRARSVSTTQIDLTWADQSNNETGFKVFQSLDGITFSQIATLGADERVYSVNGLTVGTRYDYKVTAYNDIGESAPAGPVNATTVDVPPSPPASLQAVLVVTSTSANQIRLTWADQSNNETGFRVFQSTDGGVNFDRIASPAANVTTYTIQNLALNATYHYKVQSYNSGGTSEFAGPVSATTQDVPPPPPTSLRARAISSSQIDLTWRDRSSNETGFRVYRETNGVLSEIAVLGPGVTGYNHVGLTENTQYYYKVVAYNSIGESAAVGPVSATTLKTTPASPSNLSVGSVTVSAIKLNWRDNASNEEGFRIYRSADNITFTRIKQVATMNLQTYNNTGLAPQTTYYYKVTAYNSGGESDLAGAVSISARTS